MPASRSEKTAMAATVALAGLAAKVDAPPFPGDGAPPEEVQDWIVDIMRRVGSRLATPKDIEFLRYLAGEFDRPNASNTHRQLTDLALRLEKGIP